MEHLNQIKAIFTQLVDHFDVLNNNTWSQEYFVDATYWKGPGHGPIFIDKDYKSEQILKTNF